jgi:hypothetical protein
MTRILAVARLHTVAGMYAIFWPWAIMASSLLVNILIFAAIGDVVPGDHTTGGLASIYVVLAINSAIAMSQVFPFALGMGVTRRTYYLATSLVTLATAFAYAIVLFLLKVVEGASDGFGVDLLFFRAPFVAVDNPFLQIIVYAVPFVFLNLVTMFIALLYVRWGTNGIFTFSGAIILLGGLAVALVTWRGFWDEIGGWFTSQPAPVLLAGYPAAIAAIIALAGMRMIRRTNA